MEVFVDYKDKDLYKEGIPSLKWFPDKKNGFVMLRILRNSKNLKHKLSRKYVFLKNLTKIFQNF